MSVNRVFALVGSAAVVAVAATGLYLSGPPSEQRLLRLDQERVRDLTTLSNAVGRYWRAFSTLPDSLERLLTGQRLRYMPVDPVTGKQYSYETDGPNAYRLCADFARPSHRQGNNPDFWDHDAGMQCFLVQLDNVEPP